LLVVRRLALVLVLALLAAGSAGAKEGVEATLLTAVPASAKAGTHLRIEWRLAELNSVPRRTLTRSIARSPPRQSPRSRR
jgi:hypothetical protein